LKSSFGLTDPTNNKVEGSVNFDHLVNWVTFVPDNPLLGNTVYTVTLADDVKDSDGNWIFRPGNNPTWSFTTEDKEAVHDIIGRVFDKDSREPISAATVTLRNQSGIVKTVGTNNTGYYKFTEIETGKYTIMITARDHDKLELDVEVSKGDDFEIILDPVNLAATEDESEEGLDIGDWMWIIIIIIVVVIILLVVLFLVKGSREPRVDVEYEGEEEAAADYGRVTAAKAEVQTQPATTTTTTTTAATTTPEYTTASTGAPGQLAYADVTEDAFIPTSVFRCPTCSHRLDATGSCFHCLMREKYGLW
jgi:hypothetical protein